MRQHTSTLFAASLSLSLLACIPPNDDADPAIRGAIPRAEDVKVQLPENAAKPGANVVGELAAWYGVTRTITRDLNGGTAWVLILVHTIVQFPPTKVEDNVYTWGPWDGDALDPARYTLTVVDTGAGYDWAFNGENKNSGHSEDVITGTAHPGDVEFHGHGDFTIDFDAAERVNPIDNDAEGVVAIVYDLTDGTPHLDMAISNSTASADYSYDADADGGGNMTFAAHGDTEDEGALAEDAVVRSRWLSTGAGRADVRLSGGDLGSAQVTASQCWDATFGETYYSDSAGFVPPSGAESECAFATADLPPL